MLYINQSFRPRLMVLRHSPNSVQVVISPLEKNFAGAFANILRRIIMRFTPGVGIIGFSSLDNINLHQYRKIPGIHEETACLLSHMQMLILRTHSVLPMELYIRKKGPSTIYAHDLIIPSYIKIINPDLYICTIESGYQINLTLYADVGYGHLSAHAHGNKKNILYCDTVYSPIKHISYYIHSYVSYEELILYVKTNGSCDALFVVNHALNFLNKKTNVINTLDR